MALAAPAVGAQTSTQKVKPAASRTSSKPAASAPSTLHGVYTAEQAERGRDVYIGSCRSCHSVESHTGAVFVRNWKGKPLSDLFNFVIERMPKNDPGTLAAEDVADVVAYLLKMNGMPVGKSEMSPDPDSLAKFKIDVKPSNTGTPTTQRKTP